MAMSVFLQGAGRTFHAFDAQRAGRITLDFSQASSPGFRCATHAMQRTCRPAHAAPRGACCPPSAQLGIKARLGRSPLCLRAFGWPSPPAPGVRDCGRGAAAWVDFCSRAACACPRSNHLSSPSTLSLRSAVCVCSSQRYVMPGLAAAASTCRGWATVRFTSLQLCSATLRHLLL